MEYTYSVVFGVVVLYCKEGNDRPSSVNQISLSISIITVKAENKYYTQDNTNTQETQIREYIVWKNNEL